LRGNGVGLVGNRDVALQEDPAPAQLSANPRQVGVRRESKQQLITERQEFDARRSFARSVAG